MQNAISFLDEIKKEFEIIQSVCGTEKYSDKTEIENETLAFIVGINSKVDKEILCAIIEIIYILKTFLLESSFIDLYYRVFIRKEGEPAVYLSANFIKSLLADFRESKLSLERILEKLKIEKEQCLYSGYKDVKLILQDRLKWQIDGNHCRRRLAIGALEKDVKQMELVVMKSPETIDEHIAEECKNPKFKNEYLKERKRLKCRGHQNNFVKRKKE